jgi:purine-nucleoside phosphorylase
MAARPQVPPDAERAARFLETRLGPPDLGIVLGSGFAPLAPALGAGPAIAPHAIPGFVRGRAEGHGAGVSAAERPEGRLWLFHGRLHLYEGLPGARVVQPVAILAAAGARAVLLTCAAGGLREDDRPGNFAIVADHLNLTGADPVRELLPAEVAPVFPDLREAYDRELREAWSRAATLAGMALREGVLAAVAGPCFETPAEVRMLRTFGADLVSMSTVPEVLAARYWGLGVSALTCVANRGTGLGPPAGPLDHDTVLAVVARAVAGSTPFLVGGVTEMARALTARRRSLRAPGTTGR